jgi:hypothetical protein
MNKFLAWLPALVILGAATYLPVKQMNEPKPVEKNISIEVYKGSQYASDIYANTSAQVHIIVEKVNNKGRAYRNLGYYLSKIAETIPQRRPGPAAAHRDPKCKRKERASGSDLYLNL